MCYFFVFGAVMFDLFCFLNALVCFRLSMFFLVVLIELGFLECRMIGFENLGYVRVWGVFCRVWGLCLDFRGCIGYFRREVGWFWVEFVFGAVFFGE